MRWLKSQDGVYVNPKVRLHDFRGIGAGRGVIAVEDVDEEELLFSIPKNAVLSVETSELHQRIPEMPSLGDWPNLILSMLYEDRDSSRWKPYFDMLPHHFETPMFWSKDELSELQGTSVFDRIGKEQAEESWYNILQPITTKYADLFANRPTITDYHRMGSLILAYSFEIDSGIEEADESDEDESLESRKGMVPMADMLNADPRYSNVRNGRPNRLSKRLVSFITQYRWI